MNEIKNDDYMTAKTRLANAQAAKSEFALAVLMKEYIARAEINKQWGDQVSRVKQRILALPTRLAGVISGRELSAGEIEGLAQGLITEALSELADSPTIEEPEVNDD